MAKKSKRLRRKMKVAGVRAGKTARKYGPAIAGLAVLAA